MARAGHIFELVVLIDYALHVGGPAPPPDPHNTSSTLFWDDMKIMSKTKCGDAFNLLNTSAGVGYHTLRVENMLLEFPGFPSCFLGRKSGTLNNEAFSQV